MAGIAIIIPGLTSAAGGLGIGGALWYTRYIFDSMVPLYIGWGLSGVSIISGFILWNIPNKRPFYDDMMPYIMASMLLGFGGGCTVSTVLWPTALSFLVSLYKSAVVPFKNNFKQDYDL